MAQLKLYLDFMSQPSRALYILFKCANVPFELVKVNLKNAAHLEDSFKQINRFQKVPCIVDTNGFKLSESVAIVRYLAQENKIVDSWYPKDSKKRALVDEYLEWQHNNTRIACAMYFQLKWLRPSLTGSESNPEMVEWSKNQMEQVLDIIENIWLKNSKFIVGDNITVADIFAACEIEQSRIPLYNPWEGRPKLTQWYQIVKATTNPYYDEAHIFLNKLVEKNTKAQSKL